MTFGNNCHISSQVRYESRVKQVPESAIGQTSVGERWNPKVGSMTNSAASGVLSDPGPYGIPNGLTAEGLMLYLQTRLSSLDSQIDAIFKKQQDIEKARQALSELQRLINAHGAQRGDPDLRPDMRNVIDELRKIDPALADDLEGKLSQWGQVLPGNDVNLDFDATVNNSVELVSNTIKALESSAQMEMIRLQSLMSARGTAIQLATNMIAALHEPNKGIVGNIRG